MTAVRPTAEVLEMVWLRDFGRCAWCGHGIHGERGRDWSLHHRRPAGMGGDRKPETHSPANLVLLDGSGTTYCHGRVERFRSDAMARGFLLSKLGRDQPSEFAIEHAVHGFVYLVDDGSWRPVPTPWTEAG